MKFNEVEFWVQVHNIPIVCMNRETGLFIGKQIGVLREIDLGTTGDCLDKFRALAAGVQPPQNSTGPYGAAPQATAPAEQPSSAMPIPNVMGSGVETVLVMENVPVPVHEIAPSEIKNFIGRSGWSPDLSGSMSILVWNVRGLGNTRTFQTLQYYLRQHSPTVVFFIETLFMHDSLERLRVLFGFSGKLVIDRVGHSGGLCLLWSDSVEVDLITFPCHHIDTKIKSPGGFIWRFTGFYGYLEGSQRQHSWTLLRRLQHQLTLPWLCGGDFNEILSSSEKEGGVNRPRFLINNFRQERLDLFLGTNDWLALFPFVTVHYLDFCFSDHRPILVTFYPNPTSSYAAYFSCSVARLRAPVAEFASLGYRSQAPHGVSCKSKSVSLMTSCVKMRSIRGSVLALLGWPAVEAKVSPAMNRALDGKFSAVEVHAALKQMHPSKALGLDGIPALFYHKNWKVVVLILKIPQAQHMTDFRPISLCNVLYKIIAKTLANCLRLVLGQIILDSQRWRILLNPGSLVSRVLKSLYFSNCDFLQAKSSGFHLVGFESDASSVISSILSKDPPLSEMGLVISDILALVSLLSVSHISFAPRSCNGVAHQLARFGLSIPNFLAWIEEDPPCAVDSILSDSCL
ncbi:hypothetical protein ACOSQ2_013710 [Xanthoceras sorbifolium]